MTTQYGPKSTASEVAADNASNIAGKVVLTTGVSPGGLGATFVETIAKYNPRLLILAGRTPSKVQATADKIKSENPNVETRIIALDLADQSQIREATNEILSWPENIDVIVNSAGIMAGPYRTTKDGIELQFGSNHVGHFLFTNLIMSKIMTSKSPRIVNISSYGHCLGPVRFDDCNFQDGKVYNQWQAYGQSKASNILFSKALAQKLGRKGLKAYSLHPGLSYGTSLAPWLTQEDFAEFLQIAKDVHDGVEQVFTPKNLDECSATHVVAAFDPRLEAYNGVFLEDGHVSNDEAPTVKNPEDVEKLWKLSEKLVGQEFQY